MLKVERVAVDDEGAKIVTANTGGSVVKIQNLGEKGVDLGPAGVETGKGYPLAKEAEISFDVDAGDALHAICAEGEETNLAILRS